LEGRLGIEAVSAALEAVGAERCPVCGESDTGIAYSPTFIPIAGVVPIGTSDPDAPQGIEAVCVTCLNCGLVRMHDVRQLMKR
jgi:hypothetical protein